MDTWSDDWKADKGRGIALGEKYQAIGDAIDEHYRKAFADNGKNNNNNNKNKEYDWESDRDLGQTIGENYKAIGTAIDEHYNSIKDDDGIDWDTNFKWMEYKKKGKEIGKYYKSKGDAIDEFYKGKYPLEGMVRSPTEAVSGATVPQDTAHKIRILPIPIPIPIPTQQQQQQQPYLLKSTRTMTQAITMYIFGVLIGKRIEIMVLQSIVIG
jgi:hypothetical protein